MGMRLLNPAPLSEQAECAVGCLPHDIITRACDGIRDGGMANLERLESAPARRKDNVDDGGERQPSQPSEVLFLISGEVSMAVLFLNCTESLPIYTTVGDRPLPLSSCRDGHGKRSGVQHAAFFASRTAAIRLAPGLESAGHVEAVAIKSHGMRIGLMRLTAPALRDGSPMA
jgi:hypothetical protein